MFPSSSPAPAYTQYYLDVQEECCTCCHVKGSEIVATAKDTTLAELERVFESAEDSVQGVWVCVQDFMLPTWRDPETWVTTDSRPQCLPSCGTTIAVS